MSLDKSQLNIRANYLKLLLIKDDLKFLHAQLDLHITSNNWLDRLRVTRHIFVALNNVKEAMNKINLIGSPEYIAQTKKLRKTLQFIGHFRNKASGHLDQTLIERAVQWRPMLFFEKFKENEELKLMLGYIAIIEAAINSYQDNNGIQKNFEAEIDLMYPPDSKIFYSYLFDVIDESKSWLSLSLSIISSDIEFSGMREMFSASAIAGQTDFNLKREAEFSYNDGDEAQFEQPIKDILTMLKEMFKKEEY